MKTLPLPIPMHPSEITPDWLTDVLSQSGTLRRGNVEAVTWEIIGEETGFTGVIARLRLQYGGSGQQEAGPASLIAKLPTAQRRTASG